MKNKKKNWRHILLRGSALMAAVMMCFAGSFPAFAAVDPVDLYLDGEWVFKSHLSIPDWDTPSHRVFVPFSVSGPISSTELESYVQAAAAYGYEFTPVIQDYIVTSSYAGIDFFFGSATDVSGSYSYMILDYINPSITCEPFDQELVDLLVWSNLFNSIEDYNSSPSAGGWNADFLRYVSFDDLDFSGDSGFIDWFISNAIPRREMWTLTQRLQAVAASIWSVIVTIASTIVLNPLLLFTTGFLFLGGCIALFSRLLARR